MGGFPLHARGKSRCASPTSPTGASPTSAARASTPATSPRRSSTSATTSRCSRGQPYPELDERVPLHELPSLDIYNDHFPMRMPGIWELKYLADFVEVTAFSTGTFPEPLAFSRAGLAGTCASARDEFDLVHDNQCLGYGLLGHRASGPPACIATIHHPITVDRRLEMEHAETAVQAADAMRRWYAFTRMQTAGGPPHRRGSSPCRRTPTPTSTATTRCPPERMHVVPVGVDPELFRPRRPASQRVPGRLITTASRRRGHEGPVATCSRRWPSCAPSGPTCTSPSSARKKDGGKPSATIERLGLTDVVEFVSGVTDERIVELYSEAELAVVPSLYEGFSLPAIEAMSCGVPAGGHHRRRPARGGRRRRRHRLPRAARRRRGAGRRASATPSTTPSCGPAIGAAGRQRVIDQWSWRHTAERTVEQYRLLLAEHGRRGADRVLTVDYDRLGARARRPPARHGRGRRPPRLRGLPPGRPGRSPSTTTPPS